jgi:hypothetical protein
MKDVIVIDQAVPTSIQDALESLTLGNKINWFRNKGATYDEGPRMIFPVTPDSLEVQQFTHTIYELNKPSSQLFASILPVVTAIPYTIKQMIRIKLNLCVYAQTDNPNAHGMPHVDFTEVSEQLISAVYYVNRGYAHLRPEVRAGRTAHGQDAGAAEERASGGVRRLAAARRQHPQDQRTADQHQLQRVRVRGRAAPLGPRPGHASVSRDARSVERSLRHAPDSL